ncbi:homoserine dehydrogenase [Candidatus Accumulibacter vicinus]|uniref:Homoserine dehydrogenase n=2 Tax=Candidatus Accumulibacter TaxID=327159 RepID=A0A084XY54_9PROT|nr:homoserine dehydrogenase [Candidatus Accumulibacter vicinus]KFB67398.1 MAG: Homoserine dehydrogenase [Candidatus Accumulibacter vicinus]
MKPIHVGLLGIGTVGGGTYAVLQRNAEEITRRAGRPIQISIVADKDRERIRQITGGSCRMTDDAFAVVSDPEVDIIVELIGGYGVARELVLQAIANGKHVVTANKALLARHGNEIFAAAQEQGVMVAFEAAVAGGIPIIKALREGLTANRIEWIAGIINGTTNFILSEMRDKGLSFATALQEAQRLGYAEADPTFDVEGVDAAHKLSIMSAIAFGNSMSFEQVHIEGISQLDAADIRYAEQLGYRIKLLGITKRTPKGVELRVHPTLIPAKRLIANVEGAMNAVLVKGDAIGATLYYGKGAGAEPTASAVIADLVDVTRMHTADPEHRVPHLAFQPDAMVDLAILPISEVVSSYYLRLRVEDRPGVLADVTRILADDGISIVAMIQREPGEGEEQTDIIMLTHKTVERNIDTAIAGIEALPAVKGRIIRLRLEELL